MDEKIAEQQARIERLTGDPTERIGAEVSRELAVRLRVAAAQSSRTIREIMAEALDNWLAAQGGAQ